MRTLKEYEEVIRLKENGMNYREIHKKTNIPYHTVSDWGSGRRDRGKSKFGIEADIRKSFTDDQFIEAVKISFSKAQVLKNLSLVPAGANYKMVNLMLKKLNLDTSHFTGQAHLKGKTHNWSEKIELSDILVNGSVYSSHKLKLRLIKDNILVNECSKCKIIEWQGEKLSLHLDHINGVNDDNRIENLRLLCPNCHSQTDTYCGKNKKKAKKMQPKKLKVLKTKAIDNCIDCKKEISYGHERCKSCAGKYHVPTKIQWPTSEQLIEMIKVSSFLAVGKKLGVSDNAVRKKLKSNGIDIKLIK